MYTYISVLFQIVCVQNILHKSTSMCLCIYVATKMKQTTSAMMNYQRVSVLLPFAGDIYCSCIICKFFFVYRQFKCCFLKSCAMRYLHRSVIHQTIYSYVAQMNMYDTVRSYVHTTSNPSLCWKSRKLGTFWTPTFALYTVTPNSLIPAHKILHSKI